MTAETMEPYYADNLTTLYHGDCLEIMPILPAHSFDAIICDPPYGTTACAWDSPIPFKPMWVELKRLIRLRGAIVLFGSQPFTSSLVMSNPGWFKYEWIWEKGRGFEPQLANIRPMKAHENICVFGQEGIQYNPQKTPLTIPDVRNQAGRSGNKRNGNGLNIIASPLQDKIYTDRYPVSVLQFDPVPQTLKRHSSEKPLALLEYLIRTYTNEGDTVLDFTCGSGTTLRAAKNLKRRSVGIELLEHYCCVTVARLSPVFEEALTVPAADWRGTLFEEVEQC